MATQVDSGLGTCSTSGYLRALRRVAANAMRPSTSTRQIHTRSSLEQSGSFRAGCHPNVSRVRANGPFARTGWRVGCQALFGWR
ncbi:hypothetical protein [Kibdelosporangium philippinense]|uniref:hypothetical protein n=1 Tax=Kibdelosporangium philippinense TaxID=211113 RepID=UPI003611C642